jgi:hypothetical protein
MTYKLVGQEPYQIPSNADLGTLAYQNADAINAGQVLIQNTASVSGLVAAMTVAQSQAAAGTYLFLNQVPTNLAVGQVLSGTNVVSTATVVGFVSGYSQVQPTFTSTTATTVVAMTSTYGLVVGYGVYGTGVSAGTAVSSISNTGFPVFYPVTTSTTVGSTILYVGTTTNVAVNSMVIGNNVDVGTVVTSIGTNAFVNISRPTLGTSNVGDLLTFAPTVTLNAAITANTQTQNLLFYPTITMSTPSASAVTQNTVLSAYYNPTSPSSAALVVQNGGLGVTGQSWFGSSATIVVNSNSTTPQGSHLTLSNPAGGQSTIGFTFASSAKGSIRVDSSGNFLINAANNTLYYNNDLGISNTPFSFILGGSPGGTYQQVLGTTATFLGTLIANSGTISASTNTGALQVRGGAGIGGNAWIGGSALVLGGNIDLRNSTTSSIVMASLQQQGNTTIFEFGRSDIANTPGIDFHSSGGAVDYDVRVQATGGSTTTTGLGTLLLQAGQVSITNNTTATSTTTGALKVLGGVGIGDSLYVGSSATIVSNAVATSPTTGALQVLGGAGISGNIYAGGFIDAATGFYARSDYSVLNAAQSGWVPVIYRNGGSPIITSYASTVTGATISTNTTTGALVVAGGVGIGGALNVLSTVTIGNGSAGTINLGDGSFTKSVGNAWTFNGGVSSGYVYATGAGGFQPIAGTAAGPAFQLLGTGGLGLYFPSTNSMAVTVNSTATVVFNQNTTNILQTTNATSTTTGALIVAGGAGIGRNLWVGGNAVVGSTGTSAANSILNIGTTDGIASKMLTVSDMQTPLNAAGANGILVSMYNGGGIYMSGGAGAGNVTAKYEAYGSALGVGTMSPHPVYITSGDVTRMSINSAGVVVITSTTNAISTNSGALIVQGGVGIWRDLWVGGALNVAGGINATITGVSTTATNIANGTAGAIPYQVASGVTGFIGIATTSGWVLASNGSTATWSNVLGFTVSTATNSTLANITDDPTNATPQYLTFVSASSGYTGLKTDFAGVQFTPNTNLLSAGSLFLSGQSASTSTTSSNALYVAGGAYLNSLYVPNSTVFGGPVYFNGTATYVYSTQTAYTDNILELHVPPTGVGGQWTLDDTRDIGFRFHYYNSGDQNAALVLANDTKYLEWYNTGAEGTSTFAGSSYGTFKTGAIKLAGGTQASSTQTGDLTVTGGIGIGGAVWASNVVAVNTMSNGLNSANFVARPLAGTVSQKTGMSFYGTFYNYPSDTNPRRAADIVAGFASGTWSTEFLSFNVGNNTVPNDSNLITAEQMRITTSSVIINNGYVTVSNSTNTGALQVQGGVGVGGDVNAYNLSVGSGYYLFLGGNNSSTRIKRDGGLNGMDLQTNAISRIFISDNGYINFTTTTATNISSSLQATSTTTGALTVVGGVGVGGNIVSSGYGQFYGPYNESTTNTGTYIGYLNATPRMGFFNGTASQNWQIDNFSGTFRWYTPSVTRMQLDPNGNLTVYAGTNSTSTTTGSLVLGGGAGIGGDVFVGGNLTVQTGTGSSPALVFARYGGLNEQQIVSTGTSNLAFVATGGGDFRFYTNLVSEKQVQITRIANAVNYLTLTGSATGDTAGTRIISAGNDYAVPMYLATKNYGQMQFTKGRDATTASQFLFATVGGLTTDAGGGAFWRGRHDASPNLTIGGANSFPRMGYMFETDSLTDPTVRNYYMALGNTTATYALIISNNSGVPGGGQGYGSIDFKASASATNDLTFRVQPTLTNTNYLQVNGAVSGSAPSIISSGTDATVNFNIITKGAGSVVIPNTTTSLTTTTGALVVAGGVGIGGALYLGTGNLNPATPSGIVVGTHGQIFDDGNFHIHSVSNGDMWINNAAGNQLRLNNQYSGNIIMTNGVGNVQIVSTQSATSTGTGALVVTGGVAANGNIISGGGLYAGTGTTGVTRGQITNDGILQSFYLGDASPRYQIGRDLGVSGGAAAAFGGSQGYALVGVADQSGSAFYIKLNAATGSITTNPNLSLTATALIVYTSTQAISTSTGALQIPYGGVSIGKNLIVGYQGDSSTTTNIRLAGVLNTFTFSGNVLSIGALNGSVTNNAVLLLPDNNFGFYTAASDGNVRNLLSKDSSGTISLGSGGTSLQTNLALYSGAAGSITMGTGVSSITRATVSSSGTVTISTNSQAISTTTGAIVTPGGIGVGGNAYVGGTVVIGTATNVPSSVALWINSPPVLPAGNYAPRIVLEDDYGSVTGMDFQINYGGGLGLSTSTIAFDFYGNQFGGNNVPAAGPGRGQGSWGMNYISGRGNFSNHWFRDYNYNVQFSIVNNGTFVSGYNYQSYSYAPSYSGLIQGNLGIGTTVTNAALTVAGGQTITGIFTSTNVTNATSTITGALVVAGGIGTGGDIWTGNVVTGPNQYIYFGGITGTRIYRDGGLNGMSLQTSNVSRVFVSDTGTVTITSGTTSISTTTGALVVVGGVGVGGTINAGGISVTGTSTFKSTVTFVSPVSSASIVARMLDSDVLTFSGARGQLFSISDSFTGTIFGVYDVSGVPAIEAYDTGNVILAETFGNVGVGTTATTAKLTVQGGLQVNGIITGTSTAFFASDVNSGGKIIVNTYNTDQIWLNSPGPNYGAIGNYGSGQAWGLGWSTGNKALVWNTSSVVTIIGGNQSVSTGTGALVVNGGVGIANQLNVGGAVGIGTGTPGGKLEINAGSIGATTFEMLRLKTQDITQNSTSTISFYNGSQLATQLISTWDTNTSGSGRFGIWVNNGVGSATGSVVFEARTAGATSGGYVRLLSNTGATALNVDQNQVVTITTGTNASTTNTGALVVQGGVGIWNNLWVGGSINVAGTINASVTGVITTATNLAAGTAGQMPFQTAPGVTNFTSTLTVTGNVIRINSGVQSTNTGTGALVVTGGVGISGALNATTKSFNIGHPTKPGMQLRYGSLEGPEFGVYVRGKLTDGNKIMLPDYWSKLVDPDSITVDITPLGKYQKLFVKEIVGAEYIVIGNDALLSNAVSCFYTVYAERADVDKLEVES